MGVLFNTPSIPDSIVQLDHDDFEYLKMLSLGSLGYPTINVELTDEQFNIIIKNAVQYLNTYAPRLETTFYSVQTYVGQVVLIDYPYINSILEVIASVDYLIGLGVPIQAIMKIPFSYAASCYPDYTQNFITNYASYDMAKRMFGLNISWELIQPNIVQLLPTPYMETTFGFVLTTNHKSDLSSLDDYEKLWLTKFCTARAKNIVGRIRSKYSGVSLPIGSLDSDGNALIAEAREEETALLEDLRSRRKFSESFITVG